MPAAVICEVMNDDGSMARLEDLIPFAAKHDMQIGPIADLIAFRRKSEMLVVRVASAPFFSHYGDDFTIPVYRDTMEGGAHVALPRAQLGPASAPLLLAPHVPLTPALWANRL